MIKGPLSGVVVVDLSRILAGPYCTLLMAELGARVIKVEPPEKGDDAREYGPFLEGKSAYFMSINRGKQSIALNLKDAADQHIFERLLERGDVLVENFRPGTMEKLGYGWDTLHAKYPNLIYGAASGFGHRGPYSKRAAYDMVVQGMGGIMSMTGQPDSPPTRVGVSIGDLAAGLYLAIGLVAAIHKRSQGGAAAKVDIAMLDCQLALLEDALAAFSSLEEIARPLGSRHPEIAPFQAYRTADSYVVIAAGNDHLFGLMAQAIGRPDLLENPYYKTNALRHSNVQTLEDDLEKTLRMRQTQDWLGVLNAAGVPCSPVNTVAQVFEDPQVAARNMLVSIDDPVIGKLTVAGNPFKISGLAESAKRRAPPEVDGDRAAILALING